MEKSTLFVLFSLSVLFLFDLAHPEDNSTESCICVPFFQCSNDISGEVVTDGKFLLDQRIGQNENGTKCPGPFDVCCKVKKPSRKSGSKPRKAAPPFPIPPMRSQGCGYDDNILSWAATMLFQKPDKLFPPTYKCGASIIHRDVVLTAAHCLEEEGYYFIRTGEATRKMYSVVIHPEFEMGSLRHDVAIIVLRKYDGNGTATTYPCIPRTVQVPNGTACVAATFNGDLNRMEKIRMPYVDPATCTQRLSTTRLGRFFELHESFVCAGGSDRDTCVGDGGNPLICPVPGQPGRYDQVGIVSWGIGCGKAGIPGVYVNISHVREWIDGVLREYGKN
ncbi:phenoloxidase-activating factor 2-like [Coccinella septempunctata]|uniref:phenoloxidase-activating factor 2-like n=1 Tax=Coccinella septempunctata TaxID=41139 RepID=UPI001D07576C|nr:phenoloxidase-activating factor 2-like [Coccinella septempunctata]